MWSGKKGREGEKERKKYISCEGLWEYEGAALKRVLMKFWSNELFLRLMKIFSFLFNYRGSLCPSKTGYKGSKISNKGFVDRELGMLLPKLSNNKGFLGETMS